MEPPKRPEWDDRDEVEYNLVIPFTEVESLGGPYEDTAFTAGFQIGDINGKLSSRSICAATFLVYSRLIHQVDLIAMRHQYTSEVLSNDRTWAQVGVTRIDYEVSIPKKNRIGPVEQ